MKPNPRPPRDDLFRALDLRNAPTFAPGKELSALDWAIPLTLDRATTTAAPLGLLRGHFAVFNVWTEINSLFEGRFLERFAPGSFRKTIAESPQIRSIFQHGYDPVVGEKPLGPFRELKEDRDVGVYYEVPLLDTSYNRDLAPGLEAGVYGASFRFRVLREDITEEPEASDYNPLGLPERTVREVRLWEGGPVTWGAYPEATAGLRSVTDDFCVERLAADPSRLRAMVDAREARIAPDAPSGEPERRDDVPQRRQGLALPLSAALEDAQAS